MEGVVEVSDAGEQERRDVLEVAKYLWEEYKYRHDLIWRLLFRVTAVAVALAITPFGIQGLETSKAEYWARLLPWLGVLIISASTILLAAERRLFHLIRIHYHRVQNIVLDLEPYEEPKRYFFDLLVGFYLVGLLAAEIVVALVVWSSSPR